MRAATKNGRRAIYMNHNIREANTKEPVIAVQTGKRLVYCNQAEIRVGNKVVARVVYAPGKSGAPVHDVKAWIEVLGEAEISVE